MKALIAWLGSADLKAAAGDGVGPIAQVLKERDFEGIYLLHSYPKKDSDGYESWMDADQYSSTLWALNNAKDIIDKKTILVFDEFLINKEWEEDEFKALNEFCNNFNYSYDVIAVSFFSKQVAVKINKDIK